MKKFVILIAACVSILAACTDTAPPAGVSVVNNFDLQRYQGRWFEIARLNHSFERGLSDVSATYTPMPDGSVKVVNRGYRSEDKAWSEAIGKALFQSSANIASLKVSFFGPFYGGYHVAALDPDYRWALVVGSDLNAYCWILAREKQLSAEQRQTILAQAQKIGVKTEALIWVSHSQ